MAELGPNEVTNRIKIEPLAQQKLAESLNQKYGEDAVFINKVVINDMDFEEAYNTAIQQKSIAQQNADKQKIENEAAIAKAEADKQVAIHQCRGGGTEDLHCCRCTGRGKPQDCRKPVGASDRVPEDPEMGRQAAHRQRRQCTGQHRPGRVSKYTNRGQGGGSALST